MSKALTVTEHNFALAELPTVQEIQEILQNNLEPGMPFEVREIDFPKPGTQFWQIVNEEGAKKPAEELRVILLDYHFYNVYYDTPFDGSGKPPTCVSEDGITGVGKPGGNCKTCSLGGDDAYGTGTDEKGNPTDGKACSNKIRIFPLLEEESMPHQITLPPTNMTKEPGGFKHFINELNNKFKAYHGVIISLKLTEGQTKGGRGSTKLVIRKVSDLSKEETAGMIKYAKTLRPFLRKSKSEDMKVKDEVSIPVNGDDSPDGVYDNITGEPVGDESWR